MQTSHDTSKKPVVLTSPTPSVCRNRSCVGQVVRGPASGVWQEGRTDGAPERGPHPPPYQEAAHRQVHVHCERTTRRQTDVGVDLYRK